VLRSAQSLSDLNQILDVDRTIWGHENVKKPTDRHIFASSRTIDINAKRCPRYYPIVESCISAECFIVDVNSLEKKVGS
jgi:hypothetical protein